MSYLKNIAIIGGSGQSGTPVLTNLVSSSKNFNITAITRSDSSSVFPSEVKVQRVDYSSPDSLALALKGQECLIIILGVTAPHDLQYLIIDAAVKAGVKYILPCEFGPDPGAKAIADGVFIIGTKKAYRDKIEELGGTWIGIVCGLWFDFGLAGGQYGIDIKARTARLYDDGTTQMSTSTLPQVGRGVAKLLELPLEKLAHFKNDFVRFRSFEISQMETVKAVMKATNTNESDWKFTKVPVEEAIQKGNENFKKGDRHALLDVLVGLNFKHGAGGNYLDKNDNALLGLEEENVDEVVDRVVKEVEAKQ